MRLPLLFLISLVALASADSCPNGFTLMNNKKCVKLLTDMVKHADAAASCESYGGRLVSVHNIIDNRALVDMAAPTTNPFWLGLKCSQSNNPSSCFWDDQSGNAGDFNNFANGYPLVEVGSCVYVPTANQYAGKWISGDCNLMSLSYFCETSQNTPVTDNCPFQFNGNCYFPTLSALDENEAQFACQRECANLVSIHSKAENDFVQTLFSNNVPTYMRIGAVTDNNNQNSWLDGSPWDYTSSIGYKNTKIGTCWSMALKDDIVAAGKWMSSRCDTPLSFVCKRKTGQQCGSTAGPTLAPGQCNTPFFYDNSGTFYSPNWPYSYIGETNPCMYVLDTPVGFLAKIRFPIMNLDNQASISLYSRLEDSTPLVVLEGNSASNNWYSSTTNTMKVVFRPCIAGCQNGDVYRWSAEFQPSNQVATVSPPVTITPDVNNPSGCNSSILAAPGVITSPSYPNYYPNYANCMYHLSTQGGYRIKLDFGPIETEQCCDIIVVHDGPFLGSPEIGRVSGSWPAHNKVFQSTSNSMLVTFSSDASGQGGGFTAIFSAN